MPIQILPARLANQIAAGEVVERPASVVKELIENSLDAGATQIDIEIEKGGHKRICIRDNGSGIEKQQLVLALSRHATSKISCLDDLEQIISLGFRGEALASVSSVARLTLTSKTPEQPEAWQAHAEGRDMEVELNPAAHPTGTSVDVLDLFFNTPARRKFLRTEKTEYNHIDELIKRISLSRFDVGFSVKHNGKILHKYPVANQSQSREKRMASICGKDFAACAIQISSAYQNLQLQGWLAAPGGERVNNDLQYFYVNGRMMRDKLINHAIRQAFEGLIPAERYPAYVLYLTIDADQVDVNVHPAKHEVRFHQSRLVHDFIYRAITDVLEQAMVPDQQANVVRELPTAQPNHDYIKPLQSQNAPEHELGIVSTAATQDSSQQIAQSATRGASHSPAYRGEPAVNRDAAKNYQQLMTSKNLHSIESQAQWMQVDESHLLLKHQYEFYLVLIKDLYFERILSTFQKNVPVAQPLLMPVSVSADKKLASAGKQLQSPLLTLNVDIDCISKKIVLRKVPAGLRNLPWTQILPDILTIEFQTNEQFMQDFLTILSEQMKEFSQLETSQLLQWTEHHCAADRFTQILQKSKKVSLLEWLDKQ